MIDDDLMARVSAAVPEGVTHLGAVLTDIHGRVAVYRPPVPQHGVTATLPRVRRQTDESPARTLVRAWEESIGFGPVSLFPIRQVWGTPHSRSFFFAGAVEQDAPAGNPGVTWCDPAEAVRLIGTSAPGPGRVRDQDAVAAGARMCLSPHRRVLEMVGALHAMGYEQLRACCNLYGIPTWRCAVVPASWTLRDHGGMYRCPWEAKEPPLGLASDRYVTYTSATGQGELFLDFHLDGVEFATPRELARAFLAQRPHFAFAGAGPDPDYVRWFNTALDALGPQGVYYAFAEYAEPRGELYTSLARCPSLPLPPPGPYPKAAWEAYLEG